MTKIDQNNTPISLFVVFCKSVINNESKSLSIVYLLRSRHGRHKKDGGLRPYAL